jgi:hypothetical protein
MPNTVENKCKISSHGKTLERETKLTTDILPVKKYNCINTLEGSYFSTLW